MKKNENKTTVPEIIRRQRVFFEKMKQRNEELKKKREEAAKAAEEKAADEKAAEEKAAEEKAAAEADEAGAVQEPVLIPAETVREAKPKKTAAKRTRKPKTVFGSVQAEA